MDLADVLLLAMSLVVVATALGVSVLSYRDWRRSPEEKAERQAAWSRMELTGALGLALDRAEGLPEIDLLSIFESVLSSNSRPLPLDETKQLRDRLAAIEQRFPDEATVDKIASANDAILATKVEALEAEVQRLRDDALDRWDVAQVFGVMLGLVAAVVGIVVGVNRFL